MPQILCVALYHACRPMLRKMLLVHIFLDLSSPIIYGATPFIVSFDQYVLSTLPAFVVPHMNHLPFRELIKGRDYWVQDQVLPNALEIAQRCIANTTWTLGSPWRSEPWPGMRAPGALTPEELISLETSVKRHLDIPHLTAQWDSQTGFSGHNHIQICGGGEGVARPHVDSARICDYAAVLYLHPSPPTNHCGTSFYRLHLPGELPDGNYCPQKYESLSEVPGLPQEMDPTMFEEILEVPYMFNRLVAYKSDLIHSATGYFGWDHVLASKRMAAVFFWKSGA